MSQLLNINFYAASDVGQVRLGNEDNFVIMDLASERFWNATRVIEQTINLEVNKEILLAVADGLGGALAGEVASQLAIDVVRKQLPQIQQHSDFKDYPFYEHFRLVVELANKEVAYKGNKDPKCTGLGSTFTGLAVSENVAYVGQVGDSRCYLIRDNTIKQISKDQSLVNQLLEARFITEEELETHSFRNVILQALGCQPYVNVVVNKFTLKENDVLVLCSDGLTTHVKNQEILSIVNKHKDPKKATDTLVALANERGGHDNITVILAQIAQIAQLPDFKPDNELKIEILERNQALPTDLDMFDAITLEEVIDEYETQEPYLSLHKANIKDEIEEGVNITSLAIPKITLPIPTVEEPILAVEEPIPAVEEIALNKAPEPKTSLRPQRFYEKLWQYLVKIFYPTPQLR